MAAVLWFGLATCTAIAAWHHAGPRGTLPSRVPRDSHSIGPSTSYYVSVDGSDMRGDGSLAHPWATIQYASSRVPPGATVHVAAGIYHGSFRTSASGRPSAYIIYEGDTRNFLKPVSCAQIAADHRNPNECPQLVGGSSTTWTNLGDYVEIKGFDVTGDGINGIYTQGKATIITGNHVHDMLPRTCNSTGGAGINLNGENAQVDGNYVHDIGPYPSACGYVQGIYFLRRGGFAYNNISFRNSGFGIQLWHSPSHIALVNNTIFNNSSGGIVLGTDSRGVTVDYITVKNNIVAFNGGAGISEQGCCPSSVGSHILIIHNLLYRNGRGKGSVAGTLDGSLTTALDPEFSHYTGDAAGDYHLQIHSPAIGACSRDGAPSIDFDGHPRPRNGRCDLGAYQ